MAWSHVAVNAVTGKCELHKHFEDVSMLNSVSIGSGHKALQVRVNISGLQWQRREVKLHQLPPTFEKLQLKVSMMVKAERLTEMLAFTKILKAARDVMKKTATYEAPQGIISNRTKQL